MYVQRGTYPGWYIPRVVHTQHVHRVAYTQGVHRVAYTQGVHRGIYQGVLPTHQGVLLPYQGIPPIPPWVYLLLIPYLV